MSESVVRCRACNARAILAVASGAAARPCPRRYLGGRTAGHADTGACDGSNHTRARLVTISHH
eukprot:2882472-Lingulodinium_polyedra.AAC.1